MHIIAFSFECGGFDNRLMRGGLSPLVWNLCRQYAARGHRVSLVTPAHGHLDALRERFDLEEPHEAVTDTVPLVLDPKVWPAQPPTVELRLTTRAHRVRLDGVDIHFLSSEYLDLLPDRLYPPPGLEGRDLAHFKPLVFQVDGLRFIRRALAGEPAVVHGFEPYYHYLLPAALAGDPRFRTVSTVAANAPITQKVYRPQAERLLELLGADATGLDDLDGPPPAEDSPTATMARALAGTRMHTEYGPDHVGLFPLVAQYADLVDFVSPGQLRHYTTFQDTPMEALFATLPVARRLREQSHKLLAGGCAVADSWLARDPAAVDRDAVLRGLGLDPSRPVFYHAARYAVHHKGQLELMRAVEDVLATDPEVSFLIRCSAGGGADGPGTVANAAFQAIADRHPGQVRLDWRLADEDTLFTEAAAADFCLFPSKFELDGFLIAQAEAMACGAVPIATAQRVTGHFGHALPPGDPDATGFSVRGSFRDDDPGLAVALAERIREAVAVHRTAPDTYARLSANARRVGRSFTWARSAETRLAAYERALRDAPRPLPVEELLALGWLDRLPESAWTEHRDQVERVALERGDADAYARVLGVDVTDLDADACERLFEAAHARADFARCAELARRSGRRDLTARLAGRCRLTREPDGTWRVDYAHPEADHVEVVVESASPSDEERTGATDPVGESATEALASDEPAPTGSGAALRSLTSDGAGRFTGVLDGPPVGRHLVAQLTLRSGRVAWDAVPVTVPPFLLVATDLDGTLLRSDLSVSERTRRALALVSASGARHLVVTGRPAVACRQLLRTIGYQGLAVCGQGAQLYDAGADRLLSSLPLDLDLAREVVARVEDVLGRVELGIVTSPPDSRFKVTPRFGERVRHGWDVTTDPALLWSEPIDKLILHHPEVDEDRLAVTARELMGDAVTVVHSVKGMVEILPAGTDKGTGVARAARLLGFTGTDTVAFGDMPNDIPLLAWAGHGVAMAGGHPDLRAMADEIAPGNDEDGVAAVLERLFGAPEVRS
ncbi:Cof subfamily protein (haloacid dehalogenase superfamily) [Streptomyces sp. SAI-170]|uniref:Cof-type HAD-IIB family hydrolase n=1 Tax=Streptomyces sp. SAI-170 TaxID=3377729 RepID=UPI003C7CE9F6